MAALSPKLEVPYLLPSSSARPADIYLLLWSSGTPAALDVTVISPMQQSTLKVAADRKMTLHSCHSLSPSWHPFSSTAGQFVRGLEQPCHLNSQGYRFSSSYFFGYSSRPLYSTSFSETIDWVMAGQCLYVD